ncbi:aKG-HExxH-type peptide beta-hydroxylase [Streptomyces sp. NPDC056600]|uniref:aKG-HExxH-type peptide beta-hydroxylase n=1 Tax=Streptomyces sp. NPDC056600 TaxID=3345874 RepID=UPI003683D80C
MTSRTPGRRFRLPRELFDELASGGGSPEAVAFLDRAERSRRLLLLRETLDLLEQRPEVRERRAAFDHAWHLLTEVSRGHPDVAEDLLMSPQLGSWLSHLLRRLQGTAGGPPLGTDVAHLFCLCLTAMVRAGLDGRLEVPVRDGGVVLPGLGLVRLDAPPEVTVATATLTGPRLTLDWAGGSVTVRPDRAGRTGHWLPLRTLHGASVPLDDVDPYRDLSEPIPPEPLDEETAARWQKVFAEAAAVLEPPTSRPGGLRVADVRRVVPQTGPALPRTARSGPVFSATTSDAFASMIVGLPDDGLTLAEAMVHEFQHSKLGALLHLFHLLDDDRGEAWYAPWRPDPRHLTGLLHGVYAFTGVAGFWRERLHDGGADPALAAFTFALLRLQCRLALRTLRTEARLTDVGRLLTHGLAGTLDGWLREPVAPDAARRAGAAARANLVEWRLRNLRCGDEERSLLRCERRAGRPAPSPGPWRAHLAPGPFWTDALLPLYRTPPAEPAEDPDTHLVLGAHGTARARYEDVLRGDPRDPHALTGWLLASAAGDPAYRRLLRRPERLHALEPQDPAELAAAATWLSSGPGG